MMRAHIVAENGEILNTCMVLALEPGQVDAAIGGGPGDFIVDGAIVPRQPTELTMAEYNAPILAALEVIDAKSVRPLREGDAARVTALESQAASLRAQLRKA